MKIRSIVLLVFFAHSLSMISVFASPDLEKDLAALQRTLQTLNEKLKFISKPTPTPTSIPTQPDLMFVPKGLLVFLNDSERGIGPSGWSLINALTRNAGPIITSASLLYKVRSEFTDRNKWVIKKINENLYLLITHNYLDNLNINIDSVKNYDTEKISDIELTLGLKVNHMETRDIPSQEEAWTLELFPPKFADYFVEALYNSAKNTSNIFCMRSEYHEKQNQPLWFIYMQGHGTMYQYDRKIVGLSLPDFKEVLNFLEHKINTKLLVYSSCYAAGLNAEEIYKDATTGIEKTYSFAIITQALTDTPVSTRPMLVEIDKFLDEIPKSEIIDYQKVVEYLVKDIVEKGKKDWRNLPQIKLPGLEWFSVMSSRKDIVSIGSILGKTRDPQKPLNIVSFFKTDPKVILLYAKDIPFELVINADNIEAIISMVSGDAIHKIKKISSTKNNVNKLIDWFFALKLLDPLKIFFIEEMNDIKNVIIYNKLKD